MTRRVLVLSNMPAPYRVPLFNTLARNGTGQLRVVFLIERTADRRWQLNSDEILFDLYMLPGVHFYIPRMRWTFHLNPNIFQVIGKYRPDVMIVGGWDTPAYWAALVYRQVYRNTRLVLWCGSNALNRTLSPVVEFPKTIFVNRCDSFVAYNTAAASYLARLGADPTRIVVGNNVGDISFFNEAVNSYRQTAEYESVRREYPACIFIFVGSLIPRKRPDQVIRALSALGDQELGLFIVGEGPEQESLKRMAHERMTDKVWFWGHQQPAELAKLYALADVFVLLTGQEPGSIVLSEALASGLYVIASTFDGSAQDFVIPGINGEVVDPTDAHATTLVASKALRKHRAGELVREAIQQSIATYDTGHYAQAVKAAIELAVNNRTG